MKEWFIHTIFYELSILKHDKLGVLNSRNEMPFFGAVKCIAMGAIFVILSKNNSTNITIMTCEQQFG